MFFDSWSDIGRIVVAAATAYVALVVMLRLSGKRTLSKLNAFDFVVTVALGSTLASVVLSADVALVEAITAFAMLVALQFVVAWSSARFRALRRATRSEPSYVLRDGTMIEERLTAERLTEAEVLQAVRGAGCGGLELIAAVVLETDGSLSVVPQTQRGSGSALP